MSEEILHTEKLHAELDYYKKKLDEIAGENLRNDYALSRLRYELKQKRQGFAVLAELQQAVDINMSTEEILLKTLHALNSTLDMEKSMVLEMSAEDYFVPLKWIGFHSEEQIFKTLFKGNSLNEAVEHSFFLLKNKESVNSELMIELSTVLDLPYYICIPINIEGYANRLLVSGRMTQKMPFHPPLNESDAHTLRAISNFIATALQNKRLGELKEIALQQEVTERLLLNIMPASIAERLKKGENPISDKIEEATVLFADIAGFTKFSSEKSAEEVVNLLSTVFSAFDTLADRFGVEKVKTIGDAYMVVSGVPLAQANHLERMIEMALKMQEAVEKVLPEFPELQIRIGIHTGSVVAGILGRKRLSYDIWGDTVNTASRMESTGVPGEIQVTEDVFKKLENSYSFKKRGMTAVKGKGEMTTYLLLKPKVRL